MKVVLRDYQQRGIDSIRSCFARGSRAVLFVLPTGGGKTVCFSYIADSASRRGSRVCILVHREELLMQTSRTLTSLGVTHGLIAAGRSFSLQPVQVASVQTLVRRMGRLNFTPDLVVVDEAHHATAGSWRKVLARYPDARILGVTATPCRTDGKGLGRKAGGVFDDMVEGPAISELIAEGHLARPVVYAPPVGLDLSSVKRRAGDFAKDELERATDRPSITGSAVEHYRRIAPSSAAVAFCVSRAHAEHVAQEFRAAGFRAARVDGTLSDAERREALAQLADGRLEILTSADLISEGVDVPRIETAILLRATQSESLYLQQVGRALRPSPGKARAVILDHVGNCLRHGLPDSPRDWTLDGAERHGRGKRDDEEIPPLRTCASCFRVFPPAGACPYCGAAVTTRVRKINEQDGELSEVSEEQARAIEAERVAKRQEVGRARTLEELRAVARARGYSPFWAQKIFDARRGKRGRSTG